MNCHRKRNRGLARTVLVGLAVVLACGARAGADEEVTLQPHAVDPAQAAEAKAIREAAEAFRKAFNAGDAKALAAMWTPDGDYMDVRGEVHRGREAIGKMFAALFAHARGVKLEIQIDSIRLVGKDTAIEKGTAHARTPAGEVTASRVSVVRVKRDGKWMLETVHESPCKTRSSYENLRDLEWMIGAWSARAAGAGDDLKCDLKFEWGANRNFIFGTQTTKRGDGGEVTSTQVIGWDPVRGQIRGWHFDSEGGFGSEFWTRDGKRWVLEATGVRRDASVTEAANVITPVDAGAFTWQSVRRRVNGVALPDTPVVKATRVSAKK